jgi:hypothetical protein
MADVQKASAEMPVIGGASRSYETARPPALQLGRVRRRKNKITYQGGEDSDDKAWPTTSFDEETDEDRKLPYTMYAWRKYKEIADENAEDTEEGDSEADSNDSGWETEDQSDEQMPASDDEEFWMTL